MSNLTTIRMTPEVFESLLDYSCSLPSGTIAGKRWKRRIDYYDESKGWLMGEYQDDPEDPKMMLIKWHKIEITPLLLTHPIGPGAKR